MKKGSSLILNVFLATFVLMLALLGGFYSAPNELGQDQIEYAFQDLSELEERFQEIEEHSEEDKEYLPVYVMFQNGAILSSNLKTGQNLLPLGFICDFLKPPMQKS